ncbi:NAD(P)/FAD-dependent oxidoreductase [Halalkalibacter sp. APA_J-10(15)]|uniref:NAD(P)/FAD-dependent oxidoreductase n=1 Tax=unclassified Halalkalibacter TaxID=2893063 RepID=UPI001FF53853|nr:NAD(P)/FAD-dependent oxidoreductase [Halalkalibacter sp. APA_J-10(15)]MCK0472280.1 NAD(P)/FAD-dependent oxidoreductase [Halalkalibacter sp. APA_J-10(15)]
MLLDCVIIGGGAAGLNAALVLGRARKDIVLIDEDKPRNAVTQESHGFITRDGIHPSDFKKIGKEDLSKYTNVKILNNRVIDIKNDNQAFLIETTAGEPLRSRKVILATGLKDILPTIEGIEQFYGSSLFSCPFCDGWELKDRALVVIAENDHAFHMIKMIYNWSEDLVICTNGKDILTQEQKEQLETKNIQLIENEIVALRGSNGQLKTVQFKNGREIKREGGFVVTGLKQSSALVEALGCKMNDRGGVEVDPFGRTNIEGVYACGDMTISNPAQLIIAASAGSKTASGGVVADLVNEDF